MATSDSLLPCRPAALVASSPTHQVSACQQQAHTRAPAPAAAAPPTQQQQQQQQQEQHQPGSGGASVQLSCTLSLQPPPEAGPVWVDVAVVLGRSGESSGSGAGSGAALQPMAGVAGGLCIPAGRVELPPGAQARPSGSTSRGSTEQEHPPQQAADARGRTWQHQVELVVQAGGGADAYCLHEALQQLGAAPLPAAEAGAGSGAPQRLAYSLAPPAGGGAAAGRLAGLATATWHSPGFAELALQGEDPGALLQLRVQLERGLAAAAAAAGGWATLAPSALEPAAAERAVAAAGALLAETDACVEWVEAVLRERLALGTQHARSKLPTDPAGVLRAQGAALAAAAAADASVLGLLGA